MFLDLLAYAGRVAPGLALIAAGAVLARPLREPLLRIGLLILGFILIRDAMTPTGLWRLGAEDGVLWVRFTDDAAVLVGFGAATLALTAAALRFDPGLRSLVRWGPVRWRTIGLGLAGGVAAAAPLVAMSAGTSAGGPVAISLLPALLWFSLTGNLAEEVLFRGFLQGRMESEVGPVRAALFSAVCFAACHAFLASTVTDIGWPLLAFTLYEGLICAFLRLRWGVLPAALAHGLAIFLLASGIF